MKQTLAIFDFDNTITVKDSFIDFLLQSCNKAQLAKAFIVNFPVLLGYKLRLLPNSSAKESVFKSLFKGMPEVVFQKLCADYSLNRVPKIINPKALEKIKWHQKQGHILIIISASFEDYIKPWAGENGFSKVICTKLEKINHQITGRLASKNCYGPEKVSRFNQAFPNHQNYCIYSYGDSKSDKDILKIADYSFYKTF